MKVSELMVHPVIVVSEQTPLVEVARLMLENHLGGIPVINVHGSLCGIITESDFAAKEKGIPFSTFRAPQLFGQWVGEEKVEQLYESARSLPAGAVMTRRVVTVTEDEPVESVIDKMLTHDINRIPVVRDGVPVGIVTRHDLLKLMAQQAC